MLVVRQGKTTRDQLATSVARLKAVGARTLGVTMNMVAMQGRRGYGYGYGGYGYGYGYAPHEDSVEPEHKAEKVSSRA